MFIKSAPRFRPAGVAPLATIDVGSYRQFKPRNPAASFMLHKLFVDTSPHDGGECGSH
jgi:hypothetical protein